MSNRTGAMLIAAALLCSSGMSHAQSQNPSSGNGVSNFFGNIFSGPKSAPAPQAATGPDGGPPPWSGEDGASGHPLAAVLPAMLAVHAVIGVGEALITTAMVSALLAARPELLPELRPA